MRMRRCCAAWPTARLRQRRSIAPDRSSSRCGGSLPNSASVSAARRRSSGRRRRRRCFPIRRGPPRCSATRSCRWARCSIGSPIGSRPAARASTSRPNSRSAMAASEALSLVALTLADVAGGLALSGAAGWNQTADDWAFFIQQGHATGFRTASGALIATAAALAYSGGLGWISMVLVANDWRHRGFASSLMEGSVKRLQSLHIAPVLDATPAGEPVYRQLGFRAGFHFERWEGTRPPDTVAPPEVSDVRAAEASDLDAIAALDQAANGIGRRPLLRNLLARPRR